MPLNTNLSSGYSDHIDSFLESRFLDILRKNLVMDRYGMKKTLPQHIGNTVKWNRWADFSADTTSLTEAETPDGQSLSSSSVTATLAQYGNYVTVSDWFQMQAINDTLLDAVDLLAYQAALSIDRLIVDEIQANGTQAYADPDNNTSIANVEAGTDLIQSDDLKKRMKSMRSNDVRPFADGFYRAILNPLMVFDLVNESGTSDFVILAANTTNEVQERGMIGKAYGFKISESTNIVADATSTNTYGNIFLGDKAYASVDMASAKTQIIRKPHGSAGTQDPLNQRATVGYKFVYAAKMLETIRAQVVWAYNAG